MHHITVELQARSRMEDLAAAAAARRRAGRPSSTPALRLRAGRILVRTGARLAGFDATLVRQPRPSPGDGPVLAPAGANVPAGPR